MLSRRVKKSQGKRGPTKYRGITTDASALGFSRVHLWMVLEGYSQNPALLSDYYDLHPELRKKKAA